MAHSGNIIIANVEYTQSIQYFNFPPGQGSGYAPDNSIPLISHKPTILRTYIDAKKNDGSLPVPTSVDGEIWVVNPSTGGGGIYKSLNGPINTREVGTINRTNINDTLNFLIPWQVCESQVLCQITIFDANNHGSQNSDTSFPILDFSDVPPLNVHSVLIHYTGVDYFDKAVDVQTTGYNVLGAMDYLLRVYPVSDFNFDGCEILNWSDKLAVPANIYALSSKLAGMRALSGTNDVYIGLIPAAAQCSAPCGLGGGGTALFYSDDTLNQEGAAHEIGHALGRSHTPECTAGDINYPQYNSFPRDSIGECGIDSRTFKIFDPRSAVDYMTYCPRLNWTSPYGYLQILKALQSGSFSSAGSGALEKLPYKEEEEYHFLSFRLLKSNEEENHNSVIVNDSFTILRTRPQHTDVRDSDVSIELLDEKRNFLYGAACNPSNHTEEYLPFEDFIVTFPFFKKLHTIRILLNRAVIAQYEIADREPKIKITEIKHIDKLIRLRWEGNAGKNVIPDLQYGVRFTNDGKKWRPVAASINENQIVVNTELLPGGDNCRFQILASAGFRTAIVETKPFSLKIKPREIFMTSPVHNSEYELGSPISFCGGGFSPDFGNNKSDEIIWTSISEGKIGIGLQFTTTELPVGYHWITVNVPDGMGSLASKSIAIRIVPKKPCDDDDKPRQISKYRIGKSPCGCDH